MSSRLKSNPQIWKLASDLGLHGDNPVAAIMEHCRRRVRRTLRELDSCKSLSKLLEFVAASVGTIFEEVNDDGEVRNVKQRYLGKAETGFATLERELTGGVLGITFKLQNAEPWERQYVSVIDCRGDKRSRRYFTKWHEIAHLLTLTSQMRLQFRRTHTNGVKDPEEALMDLIAGDVGFLPDMIRRTTKKAISFAEIQKVHDELCPEASFQSSAIGFVRAWPAPCALVEARLAHKKDQARTLEFQVSFQFLKAPRRELRAVKICANDFAQECGIRLFQNMRVPSESVISRVFHDGGSYLASVENLSLWEASGGYVHRPMKVQIEVLKYGEGVLALLVPVRPAP